MHDRTMSHSRSRQALDDVLPLSNAALFEMFKGLAAPDPAAVTGRYSGHVPHEIEAGWKQFVTQTGAGEWLGKTFLAEPGAHYAQRGYNRYREGGEVKNRLRFDFAMGTSKFDHKPALMLFYAPYPNWAGQQGLIDEVRVLSEDVLLGLYYTKSPVPGFTPRAAEGSSAAEFFVLVRLAEEAVE